MVKYVGHENLESLIASIKYEFGTSGATEPQRQLLDWLISQISSIHSEELKDSFLSKLYWTVLSTKGDRDGPPSPFVTKQTYAELSKSAAEQGIEIPKAISTELRRVSYRNSLQYDMFTAERHAKNGDIFAAREILINIEIARPWRILLPYPDITQRVDELEQSVRAGEERILSSKDSSSNLIRAVLDRATYLASECSLVGSPRRLLRLAEEYGKRAGINIYEAYTRPIYVINLIVRDNVITGENLRQKS